MGKIAFLFAGQGAQYPGMGQDLYVNSPAAKEAFEMAEALRPGTLEMCFSGASESLNQTINTQPCLFIADLAAALAAREKGLRADGAAGFSLGELAAAAFCGMLSFEEAFKAVCRRAELMDEASKQNPGKMFAVLKLAAPQVEAVCQGLAAYPVNYNCPGQTVAASSLEAADGFCQAVKEAGGRAMPLKVSGAFHSPFMGGASGEFRKYLEGVALKAPALPLYANKTAQPYREEEAKDTLAGQIASPVLWQKTIENMAQGGFDRFIEMGPGKTLSGLVSRIGEFQTWQIENMEGLDAALEGAACE